MMNRRAWIAFGILAVIFGAIIWGVMSSAQGEFRDLRKNGVTTEARVVKKYTQTDHRKVTRAILEVTFLEGSESEPEERTEVDLLAGKVSIPERKIGSFQRAKVGVRES